MKKLALFYLSDCPYCHYARKALTELKEENPAYAGIEIEWVEESKQADMAAQYDYYYVPTIFDGREKLYEAHPSESYEDVKRNVRAALDVACGKE